MINNNQFNSFIYFNNSIPSIPSIPNNTNNQMQEMKHLNSKRASASYQVFWCGRCFLKFPAIPTDPDGNHSDSWKIAKHSCGDWGHYVYAESEIDKVWKWVHKKQTMTETGI